jgi:hypothetical protein
MLLHPFISEWHNSEKHESIKSKLIDFENGCPK